MRFYCYERHDLTEINAHYIVKNKKDIAMNEEEIKNKTGETSDHKRDQEARNDDIIDDISDDVSFEETNEEGEIDAKDIIKKLRAKIKVLEKEKEGYMTGWQRAQADYVNFKKEVEAKRKDDIIFANKRLVEDLLPTLDAYDMAQVNQEAWNKVESNWRVGIEYIFSQMKSALEGVGVSSYGKKGDIFSPSLHESVESVATEHDTENDTLAMVMQKGYMMGGIVLRPARVKVFIKN